MDASVIRDGAPPRPLRRGRPVAPEAPVAPTRSAFAGTDSYLPVERNYGPRKYRTCAAYLRPSRRAATAVPKPLGSAATTCIRCARSHRRTRGGWDVRDEDGLQARTARAVRPRTPTRDRRCARVCILDDRWSWRPEQG